MEEALGGGIDMEGGRRGEEQMKEEGKRRMRGQRKQKQEKMKGEGEGREGGVRSRAASGFHVLVHTIHTQSPTYFSSPLLRLVRPWRTAL